jgi:two-component system, cell cycle sensor histidine kinase and response regulator CckA
LTPRSRSVSAKENRGYRIAEAGGGEEALTCIQHQPIDLVVTDMTMPGMDGRQLSEHLRKSLPDLPIIFMSGYMHPGRTPSAPWLAKPFTGEQLVSTVRAAFQTVLIAGPQGSSPPVGLGESA